MLEDRRDKMTRASLLEVVFNTHTGSRKWRRGRHHRGSFDLLSKSDQSNDDGGEKAKWNLLQKYLIFFFF